MQITRVIVPEELRHFKQVLYHSATFPAQADLELKILLP
jgi:hypothetical protein